MLVGLPLTDLELQTITTDPTQLGALVDAWMTLPEYAPKMMRFFELAFQQTQITAKDFSNQMFPVAIDPVAATQALMLQNAQQSFASRMLNLANTNAPFNQGMSTQTFAMTTALKSLYAFQDAFQVGNQVGCGLGGGFDSFKQDNPNLKITITATPTPLYETVDAGSPNYMHWYDPDVADGGCSAMPMVINATGPALYSLLFGDLRGATNGQCSKYGTAGAQLQRADFQDWRMTTIVQPDAGQTTTPFYDLPTLRGSNTLALSLPHVGFFTPAFFANWQTNASNEMRVTMNQAFIVATGAQVDGNDVTVPASTPGLDPAHAPSDSACFVCHRLLDPSRSILAATFSWDYGKQPTASFANEPGLFAFQGVVQPVHSLYDLGGQLAKHPLVASGWAQKLCYYVNSEACADNDPEFQRIVTLFQSSNYSWNQLVKAVVTSPITTHVVASVTTATNGEVVAVSRRDHLCAAWSARLHLADACGLDATVPPLISSGALSITGVALWMRTRAAPSRRCC